MRIASATAGVVAIALAAPMAVTLRVLWFGRVVNSRLEARVFEAVWPPTAN